MGMNRDEMIEVAERDLAASDGKTWDALPEHGYWEHDGPYRIGQGDYRVNAESVIDALIAAGVIPGDGQEIVWTEWFDRALNNAWGEDADTQDYLLHARNIRIETEDTDAHS